MIDFNDFVDGYRRFRQGDWARQRSRWADLPNRRIRN